MSNIEEDKSHVFPYNIEGPEKAGSGELKTRSFTEKTQKRQQRLSAREIGEPRILLPCPPLAIKLNIPLSESPRIAEGSSRNRPLSPASRRWRKLKNTMKAARSFQRPEVHELQDEVFQSISRRMPFPKTCFRASRPLVR